MPAVRIKSVRLPDDRYRHTWVVKEPRSDGESRQATAVDAKVKTPGDTQPEYKVKPNTGGLKRGITTRR